MTTSEDHEPLRPPPTEAESAWLGWVYRSRDRLPAHRCQPPVEAGTGSVWPDPAGDRGDIWSCGCRRDGQYWVIGLACDACEAGGHGDPPTGICTVGLAWRPITPRKAHRLVRRAERRAK